MESAWWQGSQDLVTTATGVKPCLWPTREKRKRTSRVVKFEGRASVAIQFGCGGYRRNLHFFKLLWLWRIHDWYFIRPGYENKTTTGPTNCCEVVSTQGSCDRNLICKFWCLFTEAVQVVLKCQELFLYFELIEKWIVRFCKKKAYI